MPAKKTASRKSTGSASGSRSTPASTPASKPLPESFSETEFHFASGPGQGSAANAGSGFAPAAPPEGPQGSGLLSISPGKAPLTAEQLNFNKLMSQLEKARARFDSRERELDKILELYAEEVTPLDAKLCGAKYQLITKGYTAVKTAKLSESQKELVLDSIHGRVVELLEDGATGLKQEQMDRIREILAELEHEGEGEDFQGSPDGAGGTQSGKAAEPRQEAPTAEEAAAFVEHIKDMFRMKFGVELDLDGIDFTQHPASFEAEMHKRMNEAMAQAGAAAAESWGPKPRKPTKAQEAKALREAEAEKARTMDLKTLYKQLAKVLHPDLEADPARKLQKQEWMQRLTKAHAAGDLLGLLSIEMQWLGVEASNLATATDQKLRVYASVLKEQIAEVKRHTQDLPFHPRFGSLRHFLPPFGYGISRQALVEYAAVVRGWTWTVNNDLQKLEQGGQATAKLLKQWAREAKGNNQDPDGIYW